MKNKVVIAIPVYKETMDSFESLSLRQCLKVLGNYDICLFGPDSLNIVTYLIPVRKRFNTSDLLLLFSKVSAGITG